MPTSRTRAPTKASPAPVVSTAVTTGEGRAGGVVPGGDASHRRAVDGRHQRGGQLGHGLPGLVDQLRAVADLAQQVGMAVPDEPLDAAEAQRALQALDHRLSRSIGGLLAQRSALPQRAQANVNCRIFPGTSVETVRAKLQELQLYISTMIRCCYLQQPHLSHHAINSTSFHLRWM